MLIKGFSGQRFFKSALWAGVAFLALAGAGSVASAATLNGTFNISVYQGTNPGGNINDANQQANQANPFIAVGNLLGSGTYTGDLNFNAPANTIGSFFSSGGGVLSAGLNVPTVLNAGLSDVPFHLTTVFVITGATGIALDGSLTHDDGISLYDGPAFSTLVAGSALPTNAVTTNFSGLFGPWELVYVAANGNPTILDFEATASATPLPAALPLFAGGLGLMGLLARRRKKNAAALAA